MDFKSVAKDVKNFTLNTLKHKEKRILTKGNIKNTIQYIYIYI